MEKIQTYVYPDGQQLSDGELVQLQVIRSGRLVFEDAYFQDLQEGDVYIIPEQAKLPPATDTEILDYLLDNGLSWSHCGQHLFIFDKATLGDVYTRHDVTDLRSALREGITELIHNAEL
jgi:hypothetical protein